MSDFTDSLVAMKEATEELVQTKEMFETIFDGYQGTLAASIQALHDLKDYAEANGKNQLSVISPAIVTELLAGDEVRILISETNDIGSMTLDVNGQGAKNIMNVTAANQLLVGALVTLRYDGSVFYVVDQVNPKTGNAISDIGKLVTDTTDVLSIGEVALNGAEISREEYSIAWAKIKNTSNLIDQASKDADPITYGGFWGEGDGSTTFTLPIVGGEFIRMFDDGRGVDTGRGFASWKDCEIAGHEHDVGIGSTSQYGLAMIPYVYSQGQNTTISAYRYGDNTGFALPDDEDTAKALANANDETRPRSIAYYGKTRL